ncbi:hypothetical protein BHM03_00054079 [Ensete ventricosum]|nr:hypothetical protein BHM03_00054079 [Ensete ventricosum]
MGSEHLYLRGQGGRTRVMSLLGGWSGRVGDAGSTWLSRNLKVVKERVTGATELEMGKACLGYDRTDDGRELHLGRKWTDNGREGCLGRDWTDDGREACLEHDWTDDDREAHLGHDWTDNGREA